MPYTLSENLTNKICIFFDTLEYQNYFISCNDDKRNKNPMRKYILTQFGNNAKEYTIHKKIRSSYVRKFGDWLFVLDGYKVINKI